jgi:hypothetical protein
VDRAGHVALVPALLTAGVDQHPAADPGADVRGDVGAVGLEGEPGGEVLDGGLGRRGRDLENC